MQTPRMFIRLAVLTSVLLAAYCTAANAYEQYTVNHDPATNCGSCHGDFNSGTYISKVDGTSWGTNLHNVHQDMLSNNCSTCHSSGDYPVLLGSSSGGNGLDPISCLGCHGRQEGTDGITGAGLRQHHFLNNVTTCATAGCHPGDSDPGGYTTAGEDVLPPYYANPGTGHPNMPTDPCNPSGEENYAASSLGLDNDGDNLFDMADPDCQAPVPDINLNPAKLNFGEVLVGDSLALISVIQNLGTADLNVTAIALCAGTSAEFSWLPPAPFTLTPGASQNLDVIYTPVDEGLDIGCLQISSNDPDEATVKLLLNQGSSILKYLPAYVHPDRTGNQ